MAVRGKTIGLCMIVRDEADVIGRCIESVAPLIDSWTICDTGSTDATPELIERALAGVPGALHQRPWRDFGANRSELMELAAGSADYLLLLDADMTLQQRGPLPELTADAYAVRHLGSLEYAIPRLVRGDRCWWFQGATHEFLATEGDFTQEPLAELAVEHHADGGARGDKLERDAALLERELERNPGAQRATFYLAQTLRDAGEDARAIELYLRRVELGGWDQEVYYAAFQAGVLLARSDPLAGMRQLIEAARRRPGRAEALLELARLCRVHEWHEAAYAFAKRGLAVPNPDDVLFVHRDVYEWRLLFELSIAAQWVGRSAEALRAIDRLLAEGRLPVEYEQAARENRRFSVEALPGRGFGEPIERLDRLVPGVELGEVRLVVEPDWPQYNPTIAADGEGMRMIVRTANYRLHADRYEFLDDDRVIRSINYLVSLDGSLELRDVAPLTDEADGPPEHPCDVRGYEDLRLFEAGGRWYALATARDRNPATLCEVVLLELDGPRIVSARPLAGPVAGRNEKNWVPFGSDDGVRILYSCGLTVVLGCDPATGALQRLAEHPAPAWAGGLRGGSQGVAVPGGQLFAVHEVLPGPVLGRRYVHRFVLIDEYLRLSAASPRFTFTGGDIEFCAGMARRGSDLVLSFGVGDRVAMLAVMGEEAALGMLQPV
jgi:glycosyltransferase involved in cell wall biosynthesis